jgi:hypothetical protein
MAGPLRFLIKPAAERVLPSNKRGWMSMSENSKTPTDASTSPLGNSEPAPTPLARGIGPNAAAKLKHHNPDATRAVRGVIERKRQGGDGHARG